jgi:hypothetical protein
MTFLKAIIMQHLLVVPMAFLFLGHCYPSSPPILITIPTSTSFFLAFTAGTAVGAYYFL